MSRRHLTAVVLLLMLSACSPDNWEDDIFPEGYKAIVPGESMFGAQLGGPFRQLREPLGRQDLFVDETRRPGQFYCEWTTHGVACFVLDTNANQQLDFEDSIAELLAFHPYEGRTTVEGFGRGTSRNEIEARWGFGVFPDERTEALVDYPERGIGLAYFSTGVVGEIRVFLPPG